MSKVNEFQKKQEEIENEVGYTQLSDILASYRLLADEMMSSIIKLESERDRLVLTLKFVQIDLTTPSSVEKAKNIIQKQLEEVYT